MNSGRLGENVYGVCGVWLNKEFVGDNGAKCIGSIGSCRRTSGLSGTMVLNGRGLCRLG